MRRVLLAAVGCLLFAHPVDAADWYSLRTEHFLLLGDASPRAIRDTGRARDLLARSAAIQQQQQVRNEVSTELATGDAPAAEQPATPLADRTGPKLIPALRDVQPGETRTYGLLTEIECRQQQIVLHVRAPGETLLLRAARFDAVDFISYRSTTPGTISCGAVRPAEDVYVTYRRGDAALPSGTSQGTAVAVELLPDGYVPAR